MPRWLALAIQQATVFTVGAAFLFATRLFTGRRLRGGQDPLGAADAAAYAVLLIAVVAFTVWFHRRVRGGPLGLALDTRRAALFAAGLAAGALLNAWPWLIALATGEAVILYSTAAGGAIALGLSIALANAFLEEVTSRAFPLRLFDDWPVPRAILLSAALFALQHFTEGPLRIDSVIYLTALGVIFAAAYVATGNIWLGTGIHAGYFYASVIPTGRAHLGAWFATGGAPVAPLWVVDAIVIAIAVVLLNAVRRRDARPVPDGLS